MWRVNTKSRETWWQALSRQEEVDGKGQARVPGLWLGQWVTYSAAHSGKESKKPAGVGRQNDESGCGHVGIEDR